MGGGEYFDRVLSTPVNPDLGKKGRKSIIDAY
jgi:hypothetical protein